MTARTGKECLSWMACIFLSTSVTFAQITVQGVSDRQNVNGDVALRVLSEAGYTYASRLDGTAIVEDQWVAVTQPGYHQVDVTRTNDAGGGPLEAETVRFNIWSERGSSEWGLYPFIPPPPIDSSSNECASASLLVVTPSNYPAGLQVPMVAVTESAGGQWKRINGHVALSAFPGEGIQLKRGVGYTLLPGQTTGTVVDCRAELKSIDADRTIVFDSTTTWHVVDGHVTNDTTWARNSRIELTRDINVAAGATLTIERGTTVRLGHRDDIRVYGALAVDGTLGEPVTFTPTDPAEPWGGFMFYSTTAVSRVTGAIFTGYGAVVDWMDQNGFGSHRDEQPLFHFNTNSHTVATNIFIIHSGGQAFHGERARVDLERCLVQRCITGGQFNGGLVTVRNSAFVDFPYYDESFLDDDNDAFYLSWGELRIRDSLFGWAKDDGVDAGSGTTGKAAFADCWIEACFHEGLALSRDKDISVSGCVAVNSGQGIECGHSEPQVYVTNCLVAANQVGLRYGDNYDWDYDGLLHVTNTISIYNDKDVWNMCRDIWASRHQNMFAVSNWFSQPSEAYPGNTLWSLAPDTARLATFINAASTTGVVGVGFPYDSRSAAEDVTNASVRVSLSMFSTGVVQVGVSVIGGDAESGSDYVLSTGIVTFAPGELNGSILLGIVDDDEYEPHETLTLRLTNAVNAEISANQAVFTYSIPENDRTIPPVLYVDATSTNAVVPYGSWADAATGIREALEWADDGRVVLVTNGVYGLSSQLVVSAGVTVRSVNGPSTTVVDGQQKGRCFHLKHVGAVVDGFTIMGGEVGSDMLGGGVFIEGAGTLKNCIVSSNVVADTPNGDGGGVACLDGGTVYGCLISGNSAADDAGGLYLYRGGEAVNCVIWANSAADKGGGVYMKQGGVLRNCTVVTNVAAMGGGLYNDGGHAADCIVYFNVAPANPDFRSANAATYTNCCTFPAAAGNSITNNPLLADVVADDFRLTGSSPCVDGAAGSPMPAHDADGTPRPLDGDADGTALHDIGAYEFLNALADTDGDGLKDGDELTAGTGLTDPGDVLAFSGASVVAGGFGGVISWPSVVGRMYRVHGTPGLRPPQWTDLGDYSGDGGSLQFTNTHPLLRFFRVSARQP